MYIAKWLSTNVLVRFVSIGRFSSASLMANCTPLQTAAKRSLNLACCLWSPLSFNDSEVILRINSLFSFRYDCDSDWSLAARLIFPSPSGDGSIDSLECSLNSRTLEVHLFSCLTNCDRTLVFVEKLDGLGERAKAIGLGLNEAGDGEGDLSIKKQS